MFSVTLYTLPLEWRNYESCSSRCRLWNFMQDLTHPKA
jgi:hypothetical protein